MSHTTTTLIPFLEEFTERAEGLSLSAETRVFLDELFRRLGETLKPGLPPGAQAIARFLEAHLGVPRSGQTIVGRDYARTESNQLLVAVEEVLSAAPYRTGTLVDYDEEEGQRVPRYRPVPVAPGQTREVLEEGYYPAFVGETPIVVGVAQRQQLHVWVHLRAEDRALALDFFKAVDEHPKLYRGQVITIDGGGYPIFLDVPAIRFRDHVVLEPQIQEEIERQVLRFAAREGAYRAAGLPFRRGLILAGPPGVGKTQVFRALTHELAGRYTVIWLTPRSFGPYSDIASVFSFARALQPTLLLWEDMDLVVQDRSEPNRSGMLGELLAQLDGAESSAGLITCASTNDTSALDKALSARPSRFDRVLHIGPPARAARLRMLRQFTASIEHIDADLDLVAERTDGLTGAYLQELVVSAFTRALEDAGDDTTTPRVTTDHFLDALARLGRDSRPLDRWHSVLGAPAR